jgi:uncharacterized protein YjcR
MTKKISEKEFTEDVNSGMPKSKLIEKYGISSDSVKKIARQLGLNIKRAVKPKFELIRDVEILDFNTTQETSSLNSIN